MENEKCARCEIDFHEKLIRDVYGMGLEVLLRDGKLNWSKLAKLANTSHWKEVLYGEKKIISPSTAKRLFQRGIKILGVGPEEAAQILKDRLGKPLKELTLKEARAMSLEFMTQSIELKRIMRLSEIFMDIIMSRVSEKYSVVEKIKRSIAKDVREKNT